MVGFVSEGWGEGARETAGSTRPSRYTPPYSGLYRGDGSTAGGNPISLASATQRFGNPPIGECSRNQRRRPLLDLGPAVHWGGHGVVEFVGGQREL